MKLTTDWNICKLTSESENDRELLVKLKESITEDLSEGITLSDIPNSEELTLLVVTYI